MFVPHCLTGSKGQLARRNDRVYTTEPNQYTHRERSDTAELETFCQISVYFKKLGVHTDTHTHTHTHTQCMAFLQSYTGTLRKIVCV